MKNRRTNIRKEDCHVLEMLTNKRSYWNTSYHRYQKESGNQNLLGTSRKVYFRISI